MTELNSSYFKRVSSSMDRTHKYTVYSLVHPGVVLYNTKKHIPLACLQIIAESTTSQTKPWRSQLLADVALYPLPKDAANGRTRFQAFVGQDKQRMSYILTNLTSLGMINFNIMKDDNPVRMVDPGGVNQWNEIRAGVSAKIAADQTLGNREMILSRVMRHVRDPNTGAVSSQPVSVEQDAMEVDSGVKQKSEGLEYYPSVVPDKSVPMLVAQFEDLEWRVVDAIVLVENRYGNSSASSEHPVYRGTRQIYAGVEEDGAMEEEEESFSALVESGDVFRGGHSPLNGDRGRSRSSGGDRSSAARPYSDRVTELRSYTKSKGVVVREHARSTPLIEQGAPSPFLPNDGIQWSAATAAAAAPAAASSVSATASLSLPTVDEQRRQSHIAQIEAGAVVDIRTVDTGKDYVWDKCSPPCVLMISVLTREEIQVPEEWYSRVVNVPNQKWVPVQWSDLMLTNMIKRFQEAPRPLQQRLLTLESKELADQGETGPTWTAYMDTKHYTIFLLYRNGQTNIPPGLFEVRHVPEHTQLVGGVAKSAPRSHDEEEAYAADLIKLQKKLMANAPLDQIPKIYDKVCDECVICMCDAPAVVAALCGHKCFCASKACYDKVTTCPICRAHIQYKVAVPKA